MACSATPPTQHRASAFLVRKATLGAVALAAALTAATAAQAQSGPFYPMVCRGGGELRMSISQLQDGQNVIELIFEKAASAYSRDTLMPGQCTWTDRAISWREPNRIFHITPARVNLHMWASQFDTIGTRVSDPRTGWPVVLTRRFMDVARSSGTFTVWARNTSAGYFEISNVRAGD